MPSENRRKKPGCRRVDRSGQLRPTCGRWLIVARALVLAGCRTLVVRVPFRNRWRRPATDPAGHHGDGPRRLERAESLLGGPSKPSQRRRRAAVTMPKRSGTAEPCRKPCGNSKKPAALAAEDPALAVRTGELYLALGQINYANRMADEALRSGSQIRARLGSAGRVAGGFRPDAAGAGRLSTLAGLCARQIARSPFWWPKPIVSSNEPERALWRCNDLADSYSPGRRTAAGAVPGGPGTDGAGRNDDAVQSLSKAASRERPTPEILCQLAEAELLSGRFAEAQATLQQALALDPDHAGQPAPGGAGWRRLHQPGQTIDALAAAGSL